MECDTPKYVRLSSLTCRESQARKPDVRSACHADRYSISKSRSTSPSEPNRATSISLTRL